MERGSEVVLIPGEIVVSNPAVVEVAEFFNWKPITLVRRVNDALPAVIEQKLYLTVVKDYDSKMQPETFGRMLEYFTKGQNITEKNLESPENLLMDKITGALSLFELVKKETGGQIASRTVAKLVDAYGEKAEDVVDLVYGDIFLILERLGWNSVNPKKGASLILKYIAKNATDGNGSGRVDVVNIDDICGVMPAGAAFEELQEDGEEED